MTANVQLEDADRNKRGGINDPLAGKTPKQIFEDCVWASNEPTPVKIFLLCICRFFDDDCRSSSMSYAQLERDTGLSERKVKELGKTVRRRWLSVGVGKGLMTANGRSRSFGRTGLNVPAASSSTGAASKLSLSVKSRP
jgi:hypothetical protein